MSLEYRILGPLEVLRDGEALPLGGRKRRIVLAALVVAAGEPVAPDRLIEFVWPAYDEGAPARLQVYISQLRKTLGDPDAIALRPGGYALAAGAEAIDATRFERHVRERAPREALALWRGPALGDLAYEAFAAASAARLEELRLTALEDRIAEDLTLGRHRELLPELEALVADHPLRERLRAAQLLALYRSGRQADALDAYLAARRALVDGLGVEPGPELRELHAAILAQDATLDVEPPEVRARRHLPAPSTPLVGRHDELRELAALLRGDGARLVTLTGPGGTGKTRLALQAAAALADRFEDGIHFVGLGAVEDPALVPAAIAAALGVDEHPDATIEASLAEHLRGLRVLLLLDNFEHVDAAAPAVSRLLAAAPALSVLTTSRSRLDLYGEHEYPVPPLAEGEAAELFAVRARAARHGVSLEGAAVAELCARLDGLPLAIELAAARSRTLTPEQMLADLPRLELASAGPRDLPERQRTLRATLEWSHRLLGAEERALFARLGVFAGGWSEETAIEVCGATPVLVAELADQSLLTARPRRSMLLTVREYALDRLAASGEAEHVRARHAEHFAALAEAADRELTGPWLERLELEHANLRGALAWCGRSGHTELELRLTGALARFWAVRGHLREGRAWLDGALARAPERFPELRAKALAGAASLALRLGDYERLKTLATEALALAETAGDRRGAAQALDRLATAAANEGDHARGMALYERSVAIFRELGDERGLAVSTTNLGCLAMMQGDYGRATAMSEEGRELYRRNGQRDGMLQPQFNLGLIELLQGRHDAAAALFDEGTGIALELGFIEGLVYFLEGHAAVRAARGEAEAAATLLGAAQAAAERTGVSLEPFEQELRDRTIALARSALGEAAFAAALAAGRALSPDEATSWESSGGARSGAAGSRASGR